MTPAEQTFTLLEESQGQAQITTVSMTHWEADRPWSINIQGPGHNVTPEQDCFCLICLSSIWFICRMKAVSFLRSWLEISVYPPCLSLPAPNLYKEQPYRRYLQLPVWLGRGQPRALYVIFTWKDITSCVSHGLKTWWFSTYRMHHVGLKQLASHNEITSGGKPKGCGVFKKIRIQGVKNIQRGRRNIWWCSQSCLACHFFTAVIYSRNDLDSTVPRVTYSYIPK